MPGAAQTLTEIRAPLVPGAAQTLTEIKIFIVPAAAQTQSGRQSAPNRAHRLTRQRVERETEALSFVDFPLW